MSNKFQHFQWTHKLLKFIVFDSYKIIFDVNHKRWKKSDVKEERVAAADLIPTNINDLEVKLNPVIFIDPGQV